MINFQISIEADDEPADQARRKARDARFRRNLAWIQAHWADVLPQAIGKYLAVAGEEAFIADTAAAARAWADAAHPDDDGAWVHFVHPAKGPRFYANRG